MKTKKSGSTRSRRLALYVGLALMVPASLALMGAGLWLALDPDSYISVPAVVAITGGALASLIGGVLMAISVLRGRSEAEEAAPVAIGAPQPVSEEQAAARAHAQKMEALGLLAGGVAHDFNNLLHVIRNSLEILQRQGPQAEARRYLDMIRRSADRAAALTGQLLAFSRRQPLEVRSIDPNDLVAQMADLLRHSLGDRITIETVLDREVWSVATDAGQLETALLNLAINARDAMPQAGLLTIETANAVLDESLLRATATRNGGSRKATLRSNLAVDQYVMIAVSDTGTGMPPEVAARACEPFFTTKEPGQGTGLGLSQVAGFAQRSGGHVRISSEPGKGTTVRLYLPKSLPEGFRAQSPSRRRAPEASSFSIKEASRGVALAVGAGPER
jgi:signal transduction histidine kinase